MLSAAFIFSIILQLVLPVGLCFWIVRKYKTEWRFVLIGGISFLCFWMAQPIAIQALEGSEFYTSQIAPLPIVWVFLFEGILLALVEQAIRAGSYWYVRARARAWIPGLTVAAGQAAFGLLLIALQLLLLFVSYNALTSSKGEGLNLTADELANLMAQIEGFWTLPWYFPLLVALQSLVILMMQFALGMMVWQAVIQRAWVWLAGAVLWETAMNTLFKVLSARDPDLLSTSLFVLTAAAHAGFLYWLQRKSSAEVLAAA